MCLEIFKIINIKSKDFNIYKDKDGKLLFHLYSFSTIHGYCKPNYLISYYGKRNEYIKIYYKYYTDWSGMTILCAKARKYGVLDSYKILQNELYCENLHRNIELINTTENKIIKEIKEYFGKMYEYQIQYPVKKDGITIYYIDLIIKNIIGIDIAIEIDEEHHNTEEQKNKDKKREAEIKKLHNLHFVRIKYNDNYLEKIRRLLN